MTNSEYVSKTFSQVDVILVDTSTLMSRSFHQFISDYREWLLSANKIITVPHAVYAELGRHMFSSDHVKSEAALAANNLLASNPDIFQVQSASLSEDELAHAFADADLLSELTANRPYCNQLLIANDRKLSSDAYDLNLQQSCRGKRIFVCYIDCRGGLQCCDCARATGTTPITIAESEPDLSTNNSSVHTTTHTQNYVPATNECSWNFDWRSGVIGGTATISTAGAILWIFKTGIPFIKNLRR